MTLKKWLEPATEISKEEYENWLKSADSVEDEHSIFTSCCGPHEFSRNIHVKGMLYELHWGWYPEEDTVPDAKYKYKDTFWWGIKEMWREDGQEGGGI